MGYEEILPEAMKYYCEVGTLRKAGGTPSGQRGGDQCVSVQHEAVSPFSILAIFAKGQKRQRQAS
ncbi:MAG: hypothetical protein IT214_01735 [Chitinophagaceae bacterium]|nr:hypothetical protein [Chitinophagaceae bacterium]